MVFLTTDPPGSKKPYDVLDSCRHNPYFRIRNLNLYRLKFGTEMVDTLELVH